MSRGVIRSDSIWDKIFFHKIQVRDAEPVGHEAQAVLLFDWMMCVSLQASLGGRLRMIITGAAPASPSVLGFLRAALGCQVRRERRP